MGYKVPIVVLVIAVAAGFVGYFVLKDGELPDMPDQYWGSKSSQASKEDISIRPFQINISSKVLTDLQTRLTLEVSTLEERIAEPLEGIGFEYGFNKKFLKKVTTHWLNKYDWRQREKALNKYPQFKTKISGIDIHFLHVKGGNNRKYKGGSVPLLLLHGWPGSFVEYYKSIPLLIDPKDSDVNFELVIPSLPGFGFSEAAKRSGLGAAEMSQIFLKLMKRLGYEKFYIQGGDWGSMIASNMATLYKDNVLGISMSMCSSVHPRSIIKFGAALALPQVFLDADDQQQHLPISRLVTKFVREFGYFLLQATKPDTIGIALANSPSGYAAYILEKFSFWTNQNWLSKEDGGIGSHYNLDELLDNVMIYWVSPSSTSGMRIYSETCNLLTSNQPALDRVPVQVPVSCLNVPQEPLAMPKFVLIEKYPNLVRFARAKAGGHFNALEIPEVLSADTIAAINLMEKEAKKPKDEPK